MKHLITSLLLAGGLFALTSIEANAVVCGKGVNQAGCVRAGGAAVVVAAPVAHPAVVAPRASVARRRVY
jgi:hypothetical protein